MYNDFGFDVICQVFVRCWNLSIDNKEISHFQIIVAAHVILYAAAGRYHYI